MNDNGKPFNIYFFFQKLQKAKVHLSFHCSRLKMETNLDSIRECIKCILRIYRSTFNRTTTIVSYDYI